MSVIMSTNLERYSIGGIAIEAKKRRKVKRKENRSLSDKHILCLRDATFINITLHWY